MIDSYLTLDENGQLHTSYSAGLMTTCIRRELGGRIMAQPLEKGIGAVMPYAQESAHPGNAIGSVLIAALGDARIRSVAGTIIFAGCTTGSNDRLRFTGLTRAQATRVKLVLADVRMILGYDTGTTTVIGRKWFEPLRRMAQFCQTGNQSVLDLANKEVPEGLWPLLRLGEADRT